MRTLAVIPARLGATRLPRKPMRLLAGQPLIVRVWERVVGMDLFDNVVVATDSDDVEAVVTAQGGEVARTGEHSSGTERAGFVVSTSAYAGKYDVVVNVQGDEPFVSRQALQGATRMITEFGYEIGTAAVLAPASVLADPNVVKVVTTARGQAMYFSRAPIPFLRDPSDAELQRSQIHQHLGIYAYTVGTLLNWKNIPDTPLEQIERLEQLRPLAAGIPIGVALIDEPARPGIDTEADLERANRDWSAFITG
ncbi:MAG TPA: 3-deoxy-manno-octulosonate cytidylyltransferase [Gemmatimonadaceae bacterium]